MADELDPDSGAETAVEAALLATRPRRGPLYESVLAIVRVDLDLLVGLGLMSKADAAQQAEVLVDLSWLAAEGHITLDEMSARTKRAGDRLIARKARAAADRHTGDLGSD